MTSHAYPQDRSFPYSKQPKTQSTKCSECHISAFVFEITSHQIYKSLASWQPDNAFPSVSINVETWSKFYSYVRLSIWGPPSGEGGGEISLESDVTLIFLLHRTRLLSCKPIKCNMSCFNGGEWFCFMSITGSKPALVQIHGGGPARNRYTHFHRHAHIKHAHTRSNYQSRKWR